MLNVLIAECEELELGYEVIGVVGSESEARELAAEDMASREAKLEGGGDPGICPYVYRMFVRGVNGYSCTLEIPATDCDGLGKREYCKCGAILTSYETDICRSCANPNPVAT